MRQKGRSEDRRGGLGRGGKGGKMAKKTYSRRDSHVVTHRSTSLPVRSLYMGERTGSLAFCVLWPYVIGKE